MVYAPTNMAVNIACYAVRCKKCHVMIGTTRHGVTDFYRSESEAADVWNRRAEDSG